MGTTVVVTTVITIGEGVAEGVLLVCAARVDRDGADMFAKSAGESRLIVAR